MEWNNGKERAKFEKEQAKLREQYLAAGMTEDQMRQLYEYDLVWHKSCRREARHTQSLDFVVDGDGEVRKDNPLYKKFSDKLTVEDKHSETTRFGWVEEIEDRRLYEAVKKLSADDLELLTQTLFEGVSQTQIAQQHGVVKVVICKKIKRIKNFLENLSENG